MNTTRRAFLGSGLSVPLAVSAFGAAPKRPNIVLILADDMGFSDLGCYGSEIATPNLDRLANQGVRFTQFCNTARCCPSRAALLTGLYSHQAGVGFMVGDLGDPAYRGFLSEHSVTIAEVMKTAGYQTFMSGKWHVGEQKPHWPTDRGFDRYFGLIEGADNYFRPVRQMALEDAPWRPDPADKRFYMTDAFTDYAVERIHEGARKPDPYFLYLAYTAPHWPLQAWPEDIQKYRGKYRKGWDRLREERHARQIEMGIADRKWELTPRDPLVPAWAEIKDPHEWDLRMAVYAAQVDRLDQDIGRVLHAIEQSPHADNTLVMFLADNGGCAEEKIRGELKTPPGPADSFTSYGRPWANVSNTPFRLYKHWVHEGGVATPFIARWPRHIRKTGKLHHQPAHLIDLMATCIDVGGAHYPERFKDNPIIPLEGKSLAPAFLGKQRELHDAIYWEHEGNRAVRQGDWKLVSRYPDQWELYNLAADRTEMHDLAAANADRVELMKGLYEKWAERCGVRPWEGLRNKVVYPAS